MNNQNSKKQYWTIKAPSTCCVPEPQIDNVSIHRYIGTKIIKYCWYVILQPKKKKKKNKNSELDGKKRMI